MAVNLEELALKSIEQYATLGVRLASLEQALLDSNRRAEMAQDKFIQACDKLSRLEEKISSLIEDKVIIHRRIDDTRAEVDKLIIIVRELTDNVKDHQDDHCGDCPNISRIVNLEAQATTLHTLIEQHANGDKDLVEVRKKFTSPQGLMFVRFVSSKWGLSWMIAASAASLTAFFQYYDFIKFLWDKFTLQG